MDRKGNYFLLSLFAVYMIIAIIQFAEKSLLPAWLYVSISFVTVNVTICETLKSIMIGTIKLSKNTIATENRFINNLNKMAKVCSKFDKLNLERDSLINLLNEISKTDTCDKATKKIKRAEKILHFFEFLEVFLCTAIILITPLRVIPYDIFTTKMISAMSLFSFSLIFFSIYINDDINNAISYTPEEDSYFEMCQLTMNTLEKISTEDEDSEQEGK